MPGPEPNRSPRRQHELPARPISSDSTGLNLRESALPAPLPRPNSNAPAYPCYDVQMHPAVGKRKNSPFPCSGIEAHSSAAPSLHAGPSPGWASGAGRSLATLITGFAAAPQPRPGTRWRSRRLDTSTPGPRRLGTRAAAQRYGHLRGYPMLGKHPQTVSSRDHPTKG